MNKMTVAYIIVSWNNKDLLDECIASINAQEYPNKKIVLVDNNSADDTVAYVAAHYPEVEVLPQADNYGFAKGNNIGIAAALMDPAVGFIALVNTDARLAPNWTSVLVAAAQRPKAACLQTITLDYYDHAVMDSTHIFISRNGQGTQGSYRVPIDPGTDVALTKVFGCNAAAIVITRQFIEAQPFKTVFDEAMFMYLEDVDLAARATVMGWDNYVVPGSRAYHMGSASSGKNPGFSLHMTYRNNARLLFVNLPFFLFLRMLPSVFKGDRATLKHLELLDDTASMEKVRKGRRLGLRKLVLALPRSIRMRSVTKRSKQELWELMERGF